MFCRMSSMWDLRLDRPKPKKVCVTLIVLSITAVDSKRSLRHSRLLCFFLLSLLGCAHREPAADRRIIPVTILHTNDIHGHGWPVKRKDGMVRGGYATQASVVEKIRKEVSARGGVTLVVSGGDVNTGVPDSDLLQAEPDFMAM